MEHSGTEEALDNSKKIYTRLPSYYYYINILLTNLSSAYYAIH